MESSGSGELGNGSLPGPRIDPAYKLFFEAAADGMLVADADEKIVDANPAACRLLERPREEVVGLGYWAIFGPSVGQFEIQLEIALERVRETGSFTGGLGLPRRDGSALPVEARIYRTGDGTSIVFRRSIAGEEEAKELRESAAQYRALVESSPDFVMVFNFDNTFRYVNPAVEQVLGYEPEELIGTFLPEITHPDYLEAGAKFYLESVNTPGPAGPHTAPYRHKDGSYRYLEGFANNLMNDPEVRGTVATTRDVTERIRAEEKLKESEQRFRGLIENSRDFVVLADENNVARYVSPSIEQILGYTPEEWVGTVISDYGHPEDLGWGLKKVAEPLAVPGPQELGTFRYRRKDGSYRYLEVIINNRLEDPILRGVVCNCRDVTDRVRAEEALRESEERFRSLVQHQPDFLALSNPDNTIRYLSPAVERVLGYEPEELVGISFFELIHPDDLQKDMGVVEDTLDNPGPTRPFVLRYRHKDGTYRHLEVINSNLIENPDVRGVVSTTRDVTDRVEAEEALRSSEERLARLNRELSRSNAELEQFAYVVSHGLRSPLRSVVNASRALLEDHAGSLDAEGEEYLRSLESSGRRMRQLVEDLLDLSRVTYRPLRKETVDLSALARSVIAERKESWPERRVEFVAEEGLAADGDPNLLGLLMENLLGNAWKYTSKKERARIEFGATGAGETRAYFVRDDGVGFDPVHTEQLFEPFRRLHRESEFEGTGIGLATVKRIVERHGGRVWAEGEEGRGAAFFFTLGPGGASVREDEG